MRILWFAFVFLSCSSQPAVPEGVMTQKKMQAVLYDVVRADVLGDIYVTPDKPYLDLKTRVSLYDTVFTIHHITKKEFAASLQYYQLHPNYLRDILKNLQEQSAAAEKVKAPKATKAP